jgi:Peptidase A4 family
MHRCFPRLLAGSLVACLPALGLALASGPAAEASTASTASARAATAARTAIERLAIGQHGTDHRISGHALKIKGQSQVESSNWSGYADDNSTGDTYSSVSGSWTEPGVSCTAQESLAAFWVGIDGYNSDSVEQDGTLAECYGGAAYYYTWWEMYPSNDVQVVGETLSPGDSITASVAENGASYTLDVTDATNPDDSFSTTQSCSDCANSSAEWIAEAPTGSSGVEPLSDFGSWTLDNATVSSGSTAGTISSFPDDEITMADSSGNTEAQPGPLNGGGNAFTVDWEAST